MSKITGKLVKLALNYQAQGSSGNTFLAHGVQLDVNGEKQLHNIGAKSKAGQFFEKLASSLKPGDTITLEKGGQYNSIIKVSKGDGMFKKKEFGSKTESVGAKIGMIVNNTVLLAQARQTLDIAGLTQAANDLIALEAHVSNSVKATTTTTETVAPSNPFADDAGGEEQAEANPF